MLSASPCRHRRLTAFPVWLARCWMWDRQLRSSWKLTLRYLADDIVARSSPLQRTRSTGSCCPRGFKNITWVFFLFRRRPMSPNLAKMQHRALNKIAPKFCFPAWRTAEWSHLCRSSSSYRREFPSGMDTINLIIFFLILKSVIHGQRYVFVCLPSQEHDRHRQQRQTK